MNEISYLEDEIYRHDLAYWRNNNPIISDEEYDKLVSKLQKLDPENEYFNRVQTPNITGEGKVKHTIKMLSLDKVYSYIELISWCEKIARTDNEIFNIMPKFDGVSGQYTNGILATRGDGEVGENITSKIPFINFITKKDNPNYVRGEILLQKSLFSEFQMKIKRKDGSVYKNERNAVQGILSRDDLKAQQILTFVDFDNTVIAVSLKEMKEGGVENWNKLVSFIQDIDYPTDGIVIQVKDKKYGESLGETTHHRKDSIAFKFSNPFQWSEIVDITWSMGKKVLTPLAIIRPVEINGSTITKVSLHNKKNIMTMDIKIGDRVKVERAGDVIPYITECIPGSNRIAPEISTCPICGNDVEYKDPELVCINPDCTGKHLNQLMDAVIRIGIERLGKPTLKKMVEVLGVTDLLDIFHLTKMDIAQLPGFQEKSIDNLFNEIQKVKLGGVYEWQLLSCLNLEGIGTTLSKKLLTGRDLFTLSSYELHDMEKIENIGPERANILIEGLRENSGYLNHLSGVLPIKQEEAVDDTDLIKVCFTGKFPKQKKEYYNLLNETGKFEISEKVNKELDILVVADPNKVSNKMKKAEKMGISVIGIDKILEKLNG